ncbi:MAG: hypothetical protein RL637_593 [Pseudomonadota bacterium]|jgi:glutamyl-tRNA synthetase
MNEIIRTRFAPSPTGYLHIGGARTALFSWLYARKYGGQFVLRIEDTDLERSTPESVNAILAGIDWLGLNYDEGPFYQTQRFDRYREIIQQLLDQGDAYYCYCSKERLEQLREQQKLDKQKPRYDGLCRHQPKSDTSIKPVVRFRNPEHGEVVIHDQVKGEIVIQNKELDDLIIARSDGSPTYNLTVVVDDMDMQITDVIRGDDHVNNTPRQINILKALVAPLPHYAHLPMILGADGSRLSKRHGAVSVMQYRDQGYLPQALLNYLVRLGWSYGDQEIFSLAEMIDKFDLQAVNNSAASFNPEKLLWLNHQYLMNTDPEVVAQHLRWHFEQENINVDQAPNLVEIVKLQRERCKTLVEMRNASRYFYQEFENYDEKSLKTHFKPEADPIFKDLHYQFEIVEEWQPQILHQIVINTSEAHQVKLAKVAQPLRVAICGSSVSPAIDMTLYLMGKDNVLKRLKKAIDYLQALV